MFFLNLWLTQSITVYKNNTEYKQKEQLQNMWSTWLVVSDTEYE